MKHYGLIFLCGLFTTPFSSGALASAGQPPLAPNPTQQGIAPQGGPVPVYRVTVVSRTTVAINYRLRSGSTNIAFRGTALMPAARGEARVESKQGVTKIDANMEHMQPAAAYGPEYLTYVMWAITPEGRAENLGEVLLNGDFKSNLHATSGLQAFGLIITAEPYFAVTTPSDVVVMENFIRDDTEGIIQPIEAKYELLKRGQYVMTANPAELRPMFLDTRTPLELYEARNAVRIARWTGADHYAADTFQKAVLDLRNAEDLLIGRSGKRPIGTEAREAVQMAEDARIITVKRIEEEQLANERAAAADREYAAQAQANAAEAGRQQAEQDRQAAEQARQAAEQQRMAALQAKADADAARAAAVAAQQEAQAETERARQAAADAERMRGQAESDKAQLRSQLLQQLNMILETRDTARGLIVNMSDVLFDFNQYTLRPGAREKLAKVSGILLAHPGLKIEVEGHTDSVGSDDYNQRLSEQRAAAVRDYIVQQGVDMDTVGAVGFGKTRPVASNDTPAGRQQNRRVEMVVSGDIIGQPIGSRRQ
jgi:outer membrane protein OmpA-like peptidoglycan-associated protein